MPQHLAKTTPTPPAVRAKPRAKRARAKPRPLAKRNGSLSNTDPLSDPAKRELQRQCYHAYVIDGRPYSAIARDFGINCETVSAYVRLEADRHAGERQASMGVELARSVAIYTEAGVRALHRMDQPGARGDELRWVIYARERIDKLYGLEARVREEAATPPAPALIAGVSHEGVTALLQLAIAIKPSTT